jgi:hypothetical protein
VDQRRTTVIRLLCKIHLSAPTVRRKMSSYIIARSVFWKIAGKKVSPAAYDYSTSLILWSKGIILNILKNATLIDCTSKYRNSCAL